MKRCDILMNLLSAIDSTVWQYNRGFGHILVKCVSEQRKVKTKYTLKLYV